MIKFKIKRIPSITGEACVQYFKEIGFNNIYCIDPEGTFYFCSRDGEPGYEVNEPYTIVE